MWPTSNRDHCGSRFSTKARGPSFASGVVRINRCRRKPSLRLSPIELASRPRIAASLVRRIEGGGLRMIFAAYSSEFAMRSASGDTLLLKPDLYDDVPGVLLHYLLLDD